MSTVEIDKIIARKIERLTIQCGCSIDPFTQNLAEQLERLMKGHHTLPAEAEMLYRAQYRHNYLDLTEALSEIEFIIFSASHSIRTHPVFIQRLQTIRKRAISDFRAFRLYTLEFLNRIKKRRLLR